MGSKQKVAWAINDKQGNPQMQNQPQNRKDPERSDISPEVFWGKLLIAVDLALLAFLLYCAIFVKNFHGFVLMTVLFGGLVTGASIVAKGKQEKANRILFCHRRTKRNGWGSLS